MKTHNQQKTKTTVRSLCLLFLSLPPGSFFVKSDAKVNNNIGVAMRCKHKSKLIKGCRKSYISRFQHFKQIHKVVNNGKNLNVFVVFNI